MNTRYRPETVARERYPNDITDDELVIRLRQDLRTLQALHLIEPEIAARLHRILDNGIPPRHL